jgi:DNA-binding response OmpR family regulator
MRLALHVSLKANNYNISFAAITGIAQVRKHMRDLIILDHGQPAGDGLHVMELLRANDSLSLIPIIALSARDHSVNMDRTLKTGAKAFKNQWPMPNVWQSSGKPSENPHKGNLSYLGYL